MNCQKPTSLNKMLRRYKNQLYEQKKVETLNEQRARSTTSSSDSSPTSSSLRGPIVEFTFYFSIGNTTVNQLCFQMKTAITL